MSVTLSSLLSTEATTPGYTVIQDQSNLTILNPCLAERKSIKIRLENGLEAYLVSDPKAEQSAAALSVTSGSWHDPAEYPGMAHFLEHMLFLGTAAYPREDEYTQFITDHGGSFNAATYPDHTVYMFSINNDKFPGALNRFSHFFIDPLFSPSCINRELHAVDQEHAKNVENDYRRQYMIFKTIANSRHPNSKFSTGNAKTLSDIPQKALKDWYLENYHASRMHLFAISTLPLNEMISTAVQNFSPIQNAPQHRPSIVEPLIEPNQFGQMVYVKPIKDLKELSIMWEVPQEFCGDTERTSLELIAYALKAETKNSLTELLKKKKLATDFNANIDRKDNDTLIFTIDVDLTPYGVSQIDTIIPLIFQSVANLQEKGIPEYIFKEIQKISLYNYQYQARNNPFKTAMKIANELLYEPLSTYPLKTTQPELYDSASIKAFLKTLTPQNCLYFVLADPELTHVPPTLSEKWTKAEYAIRQIPKEQLDKWTAAAPNEKLDLPLENPFIASELSLVPRELTTTPELLSNDDLAKIYYSQDQQYLVPHTSVSFQIKTPLVDGSAKQTVLTTLFLRALKEKLSAPLFNANIAGIHPSFDIDNLNIVLGVQGYSEKTPLLVKEIFQNLKSVQPSIEEFELYKENLLSHYDNASHELPIVQALEIVKGVMTHDAPTNQERYLALQAISYEDFNQFAQNLFKQSYLEGFLYGNITKTEAQTLTTDIKSIFSATSYPKEEQLKRKILQLPEKEGPYLLTHSTERQGNGVVLVLSQGSFSLEKRAAQQLLGSALKNAFYDTLRTKQQTGYYVLTIEKEEERELFQYFGVQSSTHQTRDLLARFDLFLEDFVKNFHDRISEERFESLQKALITGLEMPPENLYSMGDRLFLLAFRYDGEFDWIQKRIESLRALTYERLYHLSTQFLSRNNAKRVAVLVEGVLEPENNFYYRSVSKEAIAETCRQASVDLLHK
jgi:insulysin